MCDNNYEYVKSNIKGVLQRGTKFIVLSYVCTLSTCHIHRLKEKKWNDEK